MHLKLIFSTFLVLALTVSQSTAQSVLVERLPDPALTGGGVIGGFFTDLPTEAVSPLTVVTFAAPAEIDAITVFVTDLFNNYPVGTTGNGILNIFDGSTLEEGDNTLTGGDFGLGSTPIDYVATASGIEITATNVGINLSAGTYLIGITPLLTFSTHGQEFFQDAGSNGETTFLNNPGGALFIPIYGSETINANVVDLPTTYTGMAIRITSGDVLKGDVNMDGSVDLLDVGPFVDAVSAGVYVAEADTNCDGTVNLLDVGPFIDILNGG